MKMSLFTCLLLLFSLTPLSSAFADSDKHQGKKYTEQRDKGYRKEHFRTTERHSYYRPGRQIERLPSRNHHFNLRGKDYYYFGGNFFNHRANQYVTVHAPLGARVPYLSPGYVSFYRGTRHYYYAGFTYYLWDDRQRDYVVVAAPADAEQSVVDAAGSSSSEIYAYPAKGQSAEQQDRDYYDCHLWAVDKADYDPSLESQEASSAQDYRRAMTACLEGRGYSVQ